MKRLFLLPILVWLFSSLTATAQDLYVKSFQAMPMDMTASSLTGKRIDRNGEVAALIKIVTPEKDFFFDGGTLGIVDSKEETGEIWVWVPRAARKITIGHPQLGIIKNYEYPISIEAERTYEMILTTEKQEATTGSLGVDGSPDGAIVYLNGEEVGVTPKLITGLAEGSYEVHVVKEGYTEHRETVSVKIGQRAQVTVKLKASVPVGAINGVFSVSETKKVYFSKGNLQYQASTKTWRFAEHQWDFVGGDMGSGKVHTGNVLACTNNEISEHYAGWIDLFGWGTSGFNQGAVCYQPWSVSENNADYQTYGKENSNLHEQDGTSDWGYNAISNGGNTIGQWYVLDSSEWNYLLNVRKTASGIRYIKAKVHETNGLLLIPDDWKSTPNGFQLNPPSESNNFFDYFDANIISGSDWMALESAGMVFLPAGGCRYGNTPCGSPVMGYDGCYWGASYIQLFWFGGSRQTGLSSSDAYNGYNVRLVHDVDQQWGKASVYSQITFTVDADAEIWMEGEKKGVRSWRGNLTDGSYRFECRLAGHEPSVSMIEINESKAGQTVALEMHKGSLNVKSQPNGAHVFIDGNDMGTTPLSMPEMIIGDHELLMIQDGYVDYHETFTIKKGQLKQINVKLDKGHTVQFTCNVWDAQLEIDGKKVGPANGSYQLANGNRKLKATALLFQDNNFTLKVDDNSSHSHSITLEYDGKDEVITVKGVSFTMKPVEGGTFKMGGEKLSNKRPIHDVTLSSYYMGETEVTQALWKAVMGSEPTSRGGWSDLGKGDNLPVYNVNWEECQEFIIKLNQLTGKEFRLPSEAEWEYAARGGNKSAGYVYAGSNNGKEVAWKNSDGNAYHPVKTKLPNELGLYDMCGNVWEWCLDYNHYTCSNEAQINPIEVKEYPWSDDHVLRGGSIGDNFFTKVYERIAHSTSQTEDRLKTFGFRLCLPH